MKFSGANWATRSGEMPVSEPQSHVRYIPTRRPAAVDTSVRNVQITSLR